MGRNKKLVEEIEGAAGAIKDAQASLCKVSRRDLLSTGSTLLDLSFSNNPFGGLLKGKYYFLVGDSSSGKTFLAMSCFAEAVRNRRFKHYRLIHDNAEDGCLMDLDALFGSQVADRVEAPATDEHGEAVFSHTIEDFYYHLDDAIEKDEPFIYIMDSMDSLSSDAEIEKFDKQKKAARAGKDEAGSYGDGKAKKNSSGLRKAMHGLKKTNSILIIICQTRDNLGFGFDTKTRSGGKSLRFYATVEVWSSLEGTLKKSVLGKDRKIGVQVKLQTKKNRITGLLHEVSMPIYPSYGIDDIGSCIDYLVQEGRWEKVEGKKGGVIKAKDFKVELNKEALCKHIENNNLQMDLRQITGHCWNTILAACNLKRKSKYEIEGE